MICESLFIELVLVVLNLFEFGGGVGYVGGEAEASRAGVGARNNSFEGFFQNPFSPYCFTQAQ